MNGFKKLLLTTAILAASSSAMAMQAMDDESLSGTTGQDGLTVTINSATIADMGVTWIDRDGHAGYTSAGAVTIDNLGISLSNLVITVDAGSSAANVGQLAIGIDTLSDVVVSLNDGTSGTTIGVTSAGTSGSAVGTVTPILKFSSTAELRIAGGISADLRLGNRAAGTSFMSMDFTVPTITLTGLSILDAVGTTANGAAGDVGIGIGTIQLDTVVVSADIDVVAAGLQINTAGTSIAGVALERVVLGDLNNASIGDIYLTGITANSIITIAGK